MTARGVSDIVVYTNESVLAHKRGYGVPVDSEYYWQMGRKPKNLQAGDRIFFAVDRAVRGSFVVKEFDRDANPIWRGDSWQPMSRAEVVEPFRGFRYRWWATP